jgi:uncharacterized Rmd1/YagE family protein
MAMSTDEDLIRYQPDILNYGIDEFTDEHAKAQDDILRRLRDEWWSRAKNYKNTTTLRTLPFLEMDASKLTESQFNRCAVYRVLSAYALPQLTKWNASGDEDKFQVMMKFYAEKYNEEFSAILLDGVEYDFDGDGLEDSEKQPFHTRRLVR